MKLKNDSDWQAYLDRDHPLHVEFIEETVAFGSKYRSVRIYTGLRSLANVLWRRGFAKGFALGGVIFTFLTTIIIYVVLNWIAI